MHGVDYDEAVARIRRKEPRIAPAAYQFLRDALDHTLKILQKPRSGRARHISGRELCEGFRDLALQQFGPMASTVLAHWGLRSTEDIGEMVFHLVAEGALLASPEDRIEDFVGVYDFDAAFRFPFLPPLRPSARGGPKRRKRERRNRQEEPR